MLRGELLGRGLPAAVRGPLSRRRLRVRLRVLLRGRPLRRRGRAVGRGVLRRGAVRARRSDGPGRRRHHGQRPGGRARHRDHLGGRIVRGRIAGQGLRGLLARVRDAGQRLGRGVAGRQGLGRALGALPLHLVRRGRGTGRGGSVRPEDGQHRGARTGLERLGVAGVVVAVQVELGEARQQLLGRRALGGVGAQGRAQPVAELGGHAVDVDLPALRAQEHEVRPSGAEGLPPGRGEGEHRRP